MISLERVEQALAWARARLADADAEPLDAALLLAHVLGVERAILIAHPDQPLLPDQAAVFGALIRQRAAGMPVAYLLGRRAFYDRDLAVTPDVLIPRPETEHLVEAALDWARGRADLRVVDVGTGSGAIAVTLAAHLPDARIWAVDVSAEAVAVARQNADAYGLAARITVMHGDLLAPVLASGVRADLIAANLPYIPSGDLSALVVAQHEPRLALDGGPDGLDVIRRLLAQAPDVLAPAGLLLLEIGAGQGRAVMALAEAVFPGATARLHLDYAGHDRVVSLERKG
ncbi:peptide chain release factor N(5)-glutamine methyltransferase [Aggregatilinea lenta]|uniref:peptide chain release factor N(5)-glutamine methyltransferase n=1 Tax=Aggregatilinea lenta TaxID=913108 RepID=UPI000E5A1CF0|nr:peptide chain release factor N(5)-glutamine methyltransferase [Aggregatilinea lenta]